MKNYSLANDTRVREIGRKCYHRNLEARRVKARKRYWESRERVRQYRMEARREVLTHYGNGKHACVGCGFSDDRALSLDHIDGGGRKETKGGVSFYCHLRNNNYPEGYQTLCMNCQFIKRVEKKEYSSGKQKILET